MTRDADSQLQDFLDGRLSAADRATFEARMEDDSDLARRVNEYREIRRLLREDDPQLSAGFYTTLEVRQRTKRLILASRQNPLKLFFPQSFDVI